jgi:hypothetical protein
VKVVNIKTKNWGSKFKEVSNLMGLKSAALRDHPTKLEAEVAAHDGSHAYGRHGAQTGWEAQFIRAVTKVTPDQVFDPRGLNPSIRQWNGIMSYSDTTGAPVFDLFGDQGNAPSQYSMSAGNIAGGFTTPEAQFLARARGEAIMSKLVGPANYAASYRFKTGPKIMRTPLNAIHLVVGGKGPGSVYGIGFARRDPKNYRQHTRDFAVRCLEGYQKRETWGQIIPNVSPTTFKFNIVALGKNKVAFPQLTDLFEFFDLDVLWQSTCSLIYRRPHFPAMHSHGPWRLITMFPNDLAPGWAPSLWLSDQQKTALVQAGMNRNVKDYHWTGLITSYDGTKKRTEPVPSWAGDEDA